MDRNRKEFAKKLALRLTVHPVTYGPLLGGATALLIGWAGSVPVAIFGGIAGIVVAAAAGATRWMF
ncbi:MAG: hypothetical protein Q8R16_04585, partial [bacterium]|nr:hypothetical protein [bacterium]